MPSIIAQPNGQHLSFPEIMESNILAENIKPAQLSSIFGFGPGACLWDVVFVSLDISPGNLPGVDDKVNSVAQIGISMLDTRSFSSVSADHVPRPLVSRHFVVRGHEKMAEAALDFRYGSSEHIDQTDVNDLIIKLLHIPDGNIEPPEQKYRSIILVGHGLDANLLILRQRGIIIDGVNTIAGKLDTMSLGSDDKDPNFEFLSLVKPVDCPRKHLRHAGNDSNIVLQALLLFIHYEQDPNPQSWDETRDLLYLKILGSGGYSRSDRN